MSRFMFTVALSSALLASAGTSSVTLAQTAPTEYSGVIKACGAEWRARADKATNKGMEAWNAFRRDCVSKSGYVKKRDRKSASN